MKTLLAICALSTALFYWAFSNERKLISQTKVNSWVMDQEADCGIVLTGSAGRIREGFDLLDQRRIKKLLISGANPKANLREIFPQLPFYGNINAYDIILERQSRTTYGNAVQSLALIESLRCRDAILITTKTHMYRASKTFKKVFPEEFPLYYRTVIHGRFHPSSYQLSTEALKSLFYSLWAY